MFQWLDLEFVRYFLGLIPILAWPICSLYCERCGKEIGTFWILSENVYCKDCKPFLTDQEKDKENQYSKIVKLLLKLNDGEKLILPRHMRKYLK